MSEYKTVRLGDVCDCHTDSILQTQPLKTLGNSLNFPPIRVVI